MFFTTILFSNKSFAATAITSSGGSLSSGEYYLSADTVLTTNITIPSNATVTIDLNGYMLQGTGTTYVITNNGNLTIKDTNPSTTHKGNLNSNGVWVSNSSGSVTLNGGIIYNKASYMCVINSNSLYVTGGNITGSSGNLGAITNSSSAYLEITGGKIKYNYCNNVDYGGAGIFANPSVNGNSGATIKISNAEISNNKTAGSGAGIYAGGSTEIYNTVLSNNNASLKGGAIFSAKSDFKLLNSKISNNTSSTYGGGIYLTYGGSVLDGTEISNNTGSSGAGGIYIEQGKFIVENSKINDNIANSAYGGGIYIAKNSSLELTDSEVSNNVAPVYGGGIYSVGNINITDSRIIYNIAATDASTASGTGRGGGICLISSDANNPAHAELTNVTIDYNKAMYYGGGIHMSGLYASINFNSGTISNNETFLGGAGAVHVTGSSTFTMIDECKLENNIARNVGGAIHSSYGCTINLNGGTIQNNTVIGRGGGINVNVGGILNLEGTSILNNKALSGNVHAYAKYENKQISLIESSNSLEVVEGRGGGVVIDSGEFTMSRGMISNNFASEAGGGIALIMFSKKAEDITGNKVVTFTITDGIVENNTTDGNGGGIFLMENSFKNSTDTGIPDDLRYGIPTFTATGGIIRNNKAKGNGGAAYLDADTKFIMNGSASIDNNKAEKSGGAVYISTGTAEIAAGSLTNNEAGENGGGIYVNGTTTISNGIIENCTAKNGAGIYIANGNLIMSGGEIRSNQASLNGGGIFAASTETDLTVTITSGSIIGNVASKNGGGVGVNMENGLAATVTVGLESCNGLDETHSHPIIQDNTANENGGGFWLNGDKMIMNMYCGQVKENLAILEPGSANIYQTGGTATVHSGEIGEGVIVIGGEYVYIPNNQEKEITIIYDSNNPDNQEQKHALVTVGIDIYLPKNLFKRDGYVLAGWSHNPNPTENDIIYSVGEPYVVGENDITVYAIWLLEGSGTLETPGIEIGECFDEVTNGTNIIMSSNASFTTQMSVLQIQPNYYTNRTLKFDKIVPNGTNITMIDLTNENQKQFYHYKVLNNDTKIIKLTEFTKNGTNEKYINPTTTELVDEKFLFVVELPKDNEETGARQITLIRNSADSKIAAIEQTTTYTMTTKREFNLSYSDESGLFEEPTIENTINISYSSEEPIGDDTRYEGKKVALIISGTEGYAIPKDAKLLVGTNYYNQNGKGRFIIPLGNIEDSKEISLRLISDTLKENQIGANLKVELSVSRDKNNPGMGDVVAEIENIVLKAINLPAIKVELNQNAYEQEEFSGDLKLEYETIDIEEYDATIELQKKVSNNSYVTQTDLLTSVDGNSENTDGVFNIDLNSSGNIDLEFAEGFEENSGTYRVLISGEDSSGNEFEIPCNLMIIE